MSGLGCVFMASGRSRRFGRDKQTVPWNGLPLLTTVLNRWPRELFSQVVVVARGPAVRLARGARLPVVSGDENDESQATTIALGLDALPPGLNGCMFAVVDQPLLSPRSVARLVREAREHPEAIVALGWQGRRGNPVIFPASLLGELFLLRSDQTGRAVIEAHADRLRLVEANDEAELFDLDRPDDLSRAEELQKARWRHAGQTGRLWADLELDWRRHRLVAVTGGGGKTSLLWALALEARQAGGRVVVTTSTHMRALGALPLVSSLDGSAVRRALDEAGVVQLGTFVEGDKLGPLSGALEWGDRLADVTLVEADGSRGLPIKAPADHEPVVPAASNGLINLMGVSALGRPLGDVCHRPERAVALLGCSARTAVRSEMMVRLATDQWGGRKGLPAGAAFRVVLGQSDLNPTGAGQVIDGLALEGIRAMAVTFPPEERDGRCWF